MLRLVAKQALVIAGGLILFVLLFFADTTLPGKPKAENKTAERSVFDFKKHAMDAISTLPVGEQEEMRNLTTALESAGDIEKRGLLDSLVGSW